MEDEYDSTPLSEKEKELANEIRNKWREKCPQGLFPSDVERMSDDELLECNHMSNETIDDIFENCGDD